jgi:energy-coupling factor transporter ATP-binding protein EcfA2
MAKRETPKRCFISYCHQNIDRPTLDYIIRVVKDTLGKTAEILFDVRLEYGKDFSAFMALLENVDAVLIILTPSYRQRVIERLGGVYDEYSRIWNRYSELRPTDPAGRNRFDILPVLFSGTIESSTPDELRSLKQLDLTGLRVKQKPNGEFILSQHTREKFEPAIRQLASQIHAAAAVTSPAFKKLASSYYDRLFVDLKANFDEPTFAGQNYIGSIWVKTHAYNRIESQLAYFVIGRKGSGKSTMTQVLPLIHPKRYEGVICVIADKFNLETLYSLFSDQQFRSDVSVVVPRDHAFEFTWEALLMLAALDRIIELDNSDPSALSSDQRKHLQPLKLFLDSIKNRANMGVEPQWQPEDFFNFAFDAMMRFVKKCIDGARADSAFFLTDIGVQFARENYLLTVFDADLLQAFRKLFQGFTRKFLVTLDGFDTKFDRFRQTGIQSRNQEDIRRRALFEIEWLRSLCSLAMHAKSAPHHFFYNSLDFCIAAPKDRFLEVKRLERDSYRHWHRWCALNWSGIELAILLRKRLEVLAAHETDKEQSPRARLEDVLGHKPFNRLPMDVEFVYNGKQYSMPLFMYVLRHTFWRPREILVYYAALLALAEEMGRWGYDVTTDIVRKCVKATTKRVIESEFLNEFQSTAINIRLIIAAFRRAPTVMTYEQLRQRLSSVPFEFATGIVEDLDIREKMRFLYEIGFLGVSVSSTAREEFGVNLEHAFLFNEPQAEVMKADEDELQKWEFLIHPIFTEYLRLNTEGRDLALRSTWEYLYVMDAFLAANPI